MASRIRKNKMPRLSLLNNVILFYQIVVAKILWPVWSHCVVIEHFGGFETLKNRRVPETVCRYSPGWGGFSAQSLSELEKIEAAYQSFYVSHQSEVGHYFRNLYHIVRFVDEAAVEQKSSYIKILRAQLSSQELLLLFYNGLSTLGRERFKPLIEKYALLEQLPKRQLFEPTHERLYAATAFTD
jgi:Putative phage abortive infection protein